LIIHAELLILYTTGTWTLNVTDTQLYLVARSSKHILGSFVLALSYWRNWFLYKTSFTPEICALLGCWSLNIEPRSCPETSVQNYHCTLRNISEERRSHVHGGGNLKPFICCSSEPSTLIAFSSELHLFMYTSTGLCIIQTRLSDQRERGWANSSPRFPNVETSLCKLRRKLIHPWMRLDKATASSAFSYRWFSIIAHLWEGARLCHHCVPWGASIVHDSLIIRIYCCHLFPSVR
jgi:hypothetical protein